MAINIDKMTALTKWEYIHNRYEEVERTERDWDILHSLFDDIKDLQAQNERYRVALEKIAEYSNEPEAILAREALTKETI